MSSVLIERVITTQHDKTEVDELKADKNADEGKENNRSTYLPHKVI